MVDISNSKPIFPLASYDPRSGGQGRNPYARHRHAPPKPPLPPKREDVSDVAMIMGIPASEMTPGVQEGVTGILNAFDHQRLELEQLRAYAEYLADQEDRHSFLPVFNRYALFREMSRRLAVAEKAKVDQTFLCFHIGNVDVIRRSFGLAAADEALTQAALVLAGGLRSSDVIGSLDGMDFGIILALADARAAEEKALGLKADIEKHPVFRKEAKIKPAVAWGLYVVKPGDRPEEIVAAADRDMLERQNG
ncbi:MAG TPA: diguanylate cyclase [Alphaproteobacteria bacterium]|nr:diguanylate cyclase [Alphaproteobacteria bacterium]